MMVFGAKLRKKGEGRASRGHGAVRWGGQRGHVHGGCAWKVPAFGWKVSRALTERFGTGSSGGETENLDTVRSHSPGNLQGLSHRSCPKNGKEGDLIGTLFCY